MAANDKAVIVVGAGIVGVCSALELQRRGWTVTLIDRLEPGEACSFGNAGILAAHGVVPVGTPGIHRKVPGWLMDRDGPLTVRMRSLPTTLPWIWRLARGARPERMAPVADAMKALYGSTVELHEQLAREAGVADLLVPSRYLYVYRDPANADPDKGLAWRLRRERGAEIEVFDGPAIREIEPAIGPAYKRAIRVGPMAYTLNPFRLTQAYAELFRRKGGRIVRGEVHKVVPGSPVRAETTAGTLTGDALVVAAGAWSLSLVKPLGLKLPLIAERGYHVTFAEPGIALNHVVSEGERQFAASLMEMGLRIAGTEELGHADEAPSWRRAEALMRHAAELFPTARLDRSTRWMGPRPGTPDSIPAIGALPGHPNVFIAAGHGHLGLTGGPNTGRIVAALASGERLNLDLAPYAPDRFSRGAASVAS